GQPGKSEPRQARSRSRTAPNGRIVSVRARIHPPAARRAPAFASDQTRRSTIIARERVRQDVNMLLVGGDARPSQQRSSASGDGRVADTEPCQYTSSCSRRVRERG